MHEPLPDSAMQGKKELQQGNMLSIKWSQNNEKHLVKYCYLYL